MPVHCLRFLLLGPANTSTRTFSEVACEIRGQCASQQEPEAMNQKKEMKTPTPCMPESHRITQRHHHHHRRHRRHRRRQRLHHGRFDEHGSSSWRFRPICKQCNQLQAKYEIPSQHELSSHEAPSASTSTSTSTSTITITMGLPAMRLPAMRLPAMSST